MSLLQATLIECFRFEKRQSSNPIQITLMHELESDDLILQLARAGGQGLKTKRSGEEVGGRGTQAVLVSLALWA